MVEKEFHLSEIQKNIESGYTTDARQVVSELKNIESKEQLHFYHVTTSKTKVGEEGLKSGKMLEGKEALGGSGGEFISVTYSSEKAKIIKDYLKIIVKAAKGMISPKEIVDDLWELFEMDKLPSDKDLELIDYAASKDVAQNSPKSEEEKFIDRLNTLSPKEAIFQWKEILENKYNYNDSTDYKDRRLVRLCRIIDDNWGSFRAINLIDDREKRVNVMAEFEQLEKINLDEIAILNVEVKKNASYNYSPMELEVKFKPEDIRIKNT